MSQPIELIDLRPLAMVAVLFAASFASAADTCEKQLPNLVDRSLFIVAAKVAQLGPAPGFWTGGVLPAIQNVKYDVVESYKGELPAKQISVDHYVVKGSRLTEKRPPGLSRQFFAQGNAVILFLRTPQQDIGGECAVQPQTAELEQQVKELVRTTH